MFQSATQSVYIGTLGAPNLSSQDPLVTFPCSRVGGEPVWHDELSKPDLRSIVCGHCQSSDSIIFLCQIYAPIEYDRSLYIFGCNRRLCSLRHKGWIILRNQSSTLSTPKSNSAEIEFAGKDSVQKEVQTKTDSVWGFLNDNKDPFSAEEGFGFDDFAELDNLLKDRDNTPAAVANPAKENSAKKVDHPIKDNTATCVGLIDLKSDYPFDVLESYSVIDYEEDPKQSLRNTKANREGKVEEANDEDGEDDDDDDDDDDEALDGFGALSDVHYNRLIESYLSAEEDGSIVALLREQMGTGKAGRVTKSVASNGRGAKKASNQSHGTASSNASGKSHRTGLGVAGNSKQGQRTAGASGMDKKLSRNSKGDKIERLFQKAVAADPKQIFRYAYGGKPLWCTLPPMIVSDPAPSKSTLHTLHSDNIDSNVRSVVIPTCEFCHEPRVFEMQLMPVLLGVLMVKKVIQGKKSPEREQKVCYPHERSSQQLSSTPGLSIIGHGQDDSSDSESDEGINGKSNSVANIIAEEVVVAGQQQLQRFVDSLDTGIDFGILALFSCPNSCYPGGNNALIREYAVVQAPPDIGLLQ